MHSVSESGRFTSTYDIRSGGRSLSLSDADFSRRGETATRHNRSAVGVDNFLLHESSGQQYSCGSCFCYANCVVCNRPAILQSNSPSWGKYKQCSDLSFDWSNVLSCLLLNRVERVGANQVGGQCRTHSGQASLSSSPFVRTCSSWSSYQRLAKSYYGRFWPATRSSSCALTWRTRRAVPWHGALHNKPWTVLTPTRQCEPQV